VVLSLAVATTVLCVAALVTGLVALTIGQPYGVWYPQVLMGVIGTAVIGSLIPTIKRRYAEQELRRMSAADAAA
jgi:hypothetical protein